MPIKHAAVKALAQAKKATIKNKALITKIKKLRKDIVKAAHSKEADKVKTMWQDFVQTVDKSSKGSTLHRNTGARLKSRLAAQVKKLTAQIAK